ncbi:carcinoembryonic antigen-related cell adhesion molecule 5-like [Limanda limanda]|uniref:carcinoembryonic antigen-related cell adhesion molecule 5-like n=1 Tax=Limanda limanda TaxID=27771 RepID=UPI0029C84710|nr:carcinoembryonic antigen-related cell adhesion molecule 5-like [Limanda limanda]
MQTVVHCGNGWDVSYTSTEICAVRGSTVDITCTYTYPSTFNNHDTTVQETLWFIQESNGIHVDLRTDPEYSGRVENLCGNNKCTLRISNLRESDSAVYKFRFTTNQPGGRLTGSAGVTLSVTGVQVLSTKLSDCLMGDCSWSSVECRTRCPPTPSLSYIWYKNGQKTPGEKSYRDYFYSRDSISCAVRGQEDFPSAPVYAPKPPSLSVSPSGEIMEGSSVTLTCSSDANPAAHYTWYKEDEDSPTASGQNFTITNITAEHGGKYQCEAQNTHGRSNTTLHLTVGAEKSVITMNIIWYTLVVVLVPVLVWTLWTRMKKTLSLKSEVNEAVEMIESHNCPVYESFDAAAQTEDTEEQEDLVHCDWLMKALVLSQFDLGVSYTSTEICAFRGSTVDINCTYTYPSRLNRLDTTVQETFWFVKESNGIQVDLRTDPEYSGRVENLCGNNKCTLRISNLRESDSAVYKFRFTTNQPNGSLTGSAGVTLSVTDPQLQVHVRRSTANPSSTWTELTCHSRCQLPDHLSYVWYKNNKPVGRKKYFHLRHFNAEDNYHCAIEGQERFPSPTLDAPKPPSVSVSPSGEIMEGSSVNLTCSSDANPAAKYTWYKRNGDKKVQPPSEETQFVLSSIRSSDSGEYYCTAENELGRSSANILITVTYAPKPPSVSVSLSGEIMEGSSVTLTCSSDANPAAKYTWYKQDEDSPTASGQIFTITNITAEHGGKYQCEAKNTHGRSKATLHLTVGAGKSVIIMNIIRLTLVVVLVPVLVWTLWTRPSAPDAPKPPSMSVSPSGEIMEGSSVTLTCSSDANPAANYTWYKEDEDSPTASGQNFTITNITAEHGGNYQCEAQNTHGRSNTTLHLTVGADVSQLYIKTIKLHMNNTD